MRKPTVPFFLKGLVVIGVTVGVLSVLPSSLLLPEPAIPSGQPPAVGPEPGNIAPDFSLLEADGSEMTLVEHRGKHRVALNFFATWCEACRLEMPGVQSQYEKHQPHDWIVVGISIREPVWDVTAFRDELGLTFPLLLDQQGTVTSQYAVSGTPTMILIDETGEIIDRRLGYMSEAGIEAMLCPEEVSETTCK